MNQLRQSDRDSIVKDVMNRIDSLLEPKLVKAVATEVNSAVAVALEKLKPHGWSRVWFWAREWAILGTLITVMVGILALAATAFYQATARVDKQARFETKTADDLDKITKRLDKIDGTLAGQQASFSSALPLADFKGALHDVANSVSIVRQQGVTLSPPVFVALRDKLVATETKAPGYWPAVAQLINYQSSMTTINSGQDVPDCFKSAPQPGRVSDVGPHGELKAFTIPVYENCKFTLDAPEDEARFNSLVQNGLPSIEFRHCLIVYKGGPYALVTHLSVRDAPFLTNGKGTGARLNFDGPTMQFVQCKFDFSVKESVPVKYQNLMQAVLRDPVNVINES